jgi:hypothetical protein
MNDVEFRIYFYEYLCGTYVICTYVTPVNVLIGRYINIIEAEEIS